MSLLRKPELKQLQAAMDQFAGVSMVKMAHSLSGDLLL